MEKEQQIQESQYHFPYHHLVRYGNRKFSQARELRWGYIYMGYISYAAKQLSGMQFQTLLDVGCGDGKFLFEVHKLLPEKIVEGVDYSEQAVLFARAFTKDVNITVGDITKKEVCNKEYDIVTLIETLEHIPKKDISSFLEALSKRVPTGGALVLTVPSTNIPVSGKHYQHFNIATLKQVLEPYFEISDYQFLNRQGFGVALIRFLFTNRLFILNTQRVTSFLYRIYVRYFLIAKEHNGERIFAVCKKQ